MAPVFTRFENGADSALFFAAPNVTLLGHRNPVRRILGAVRGLVHRPAAAANPRPVAVVGHRGLAREAAENTLESFAKAIASGANAIETDVCVTRDGQFVLWHDCRPDDKVALFRQTVEENYMYEPDVPAVGSPWRRPVNELDLADLRRHYGYVLREGEGERKTRIPFILLDDLLAWLPSEPRLDLVCLDVKLGEKQTAGARDLARYARDARQSGRIPESIRLAFLCPEREILQAILTESRREPLGRGTSIFADFEFPDALEIAKRFGANCVSFGMGRRLWPDLRDELAGVLAARDAGRMDSVIVWNVNDEKKLRELVSWRVDGILTDDVRLLRRIVSEESPAA
jgi:glycerophosphoryl diester phosphodiesterase